MITKAGYDFYKGKKREYWRLVAPVIRDGELNETSSGKAVGKASVKAYTKEDDTAVFMTLIGWRDMAGRVANLRKGDTADAVGTINEREYNGKTYVDFTVEYVQANSSVTALAEKISGAGYSAPTAQDPFAEPADDDGELPF